MIAFMHRKKIVIHTASIIPHTIGHFLSIVKTIDRTATTKGIKVVKAMAYSHLPVRNHTARPSTMAKI
jgi:hypothetical protein